MSATCENIPPNIEPSAVNSDRAVKSCVPKSTLPVAPMYGTNVDAAPRENQAQQGGFQAAPPAAQPQDDLPF